MLPKPLLDTTLLRSIEATNALAEVLNLPISRKRFTALVVSGKGPPIAGMWGREYRFTWGAVRQWALDRLHDTAA